MRLVKKLNIQFCTKDYVVQFDDLENFRNLEQVVERAYGPKGLGILFVDNIPQYPQIRKKTLPLFHKMAKLPDNVLRKYTKPEIYHRIGWSHGVQKIQGKYDVSKASYFNNCLRDYPQPIPLSEQPYYTEQQRKILMAPNIWIDQLPQLETNIKSMSKIMIKVGKLICKQIDQIAFKKVENYKNGNLVRMLNETPNYIGRMLHYLPYQIKPEDNLSQQLICGWHNDYGIITGLTSAMYLDDNGKQSNIKLKTGDFCAKNRFAQAVQILIPEDMLAFQIGQATQVFTGGYLQATPHSVMRNRQVGSNNLSRNTFACFMGPPYLQKISVPEGSSLEKVVGKQAYNVPRLKDRWFNGMYYKDLYKKNLQYYA